MLTGIFIATLVSFSFAKGDVYSTCYEYETYCLFSFGPNVTVNNVKEAQKICEDARRGSWLLEIVDDRTLKNVEEFLSKHSFPEDTKLILNAEQFNRQWRWIKNKSEFFMGSVIKDLKSLKDTLLYHRQNKAGQNSNESHQFSFICMTECFSKFEQHDKLMLVHPLGLHPTGQWNLTTAECRHQCEALPCEAYEWNFKTGPGHYSCLLHQTINGKAFTYNENRILYVIDRSVKMTDVCIGDTTDFLFSLDFDSVMLVAILIPSASFLFISVILCVISVHFCKRRLQEKVDQRLRRPPINVNESARITGNEYNCNSTEEQYSTPSPAYKNLDRKISIVHKYRNLIQSSNHGLMLTTKL